MNDPLEHQRLRMAAEQVRQACIARAKAAYFDAAASGLCAEGALEAALGAIQTLDLDALLRQLAADRA